MKQKKLNNQLSKELDNLREKINSLDQSILETLNKRTDIVLEIAEIKKRLNYPFYVPHREQEIYQRLTKLNTGPFPNEAIKSVFREIMSASIALEKPLKIAYLGPEASYTQMAAVQKFGTQVEFVPLDSIGAVFTEVGKKWADYGVVPIENSTEGVINHTLDMFIDFDLKVCSEIVLNISHNLLGRGKLQDIKSIYSRDSALAQCRQWLLNNLPKAESVAVSSTTKGVQLALKNKKVAAIASSLAANIYDIPILAQGIEDVHGNRTRFLVIGESDSKKTGQDKTSIMFSIKDKIGALYAALQPFQKYKINLTKIESRPSRRRAWDYVFFVDFEGYRDDIPIAKALKEVLEHCMYLRVLGSYPMSSMKKDGHFLE